MSQSQYASQSNSWEVFKCWTAAQDRWSSHKYNNGSFYIFTHTLTASNSNRFHLKKKKKKGQQPKKTNKKTLQEDTHTHHSDISLSHDPSLLWSGFLDAPNRNLHLRYVWISISSRSETEREMCVLNTLRCACCLHYLKIGRIVAVRGQQGQH